MMGLSCSSAPEAITGETLHDLRARHGVHSISVAVIRGGQMVYAQASGEARAGQAATSETIYSLASVSKVVVGLSAARLMALSPGALDLDADVNVYLGWARPLAHPSYPGQAVTLRQLLRHEAGIAENTSADYDTYPKPDPEGDLGAFLEPLMATAAGWRDSAPGAAYHYSNVGVALAAHVIEQAAGEDFEVFCDRTIFTPLGMNDTRWFFNDLSSAQQARVALPFDEDGEAYEHYGFDDWPSGQLRSSAPDMARLLIMLSGDGGALMSAASVAAFEAVPMLIDAEDDLFSHSGGESGVNTYVEYTGQGDGYVMLVNSDLEDDALDALMEDVGAFVARQ
jgi:CubicO group peptidase (beta-lactamase class C family)